MGSDFGAEQDANYLRERDRTFDRILLAIGQNIAATPVVFSLDIHVLSPSAAQAGATREAWRLLQSGVEHLKSGAPGGKNGSLSGALEKASVRASALASAVGVKPPHFEETFYFAAHDSGAEEAVFLTRRLVEAATADLAHSRQIIGAQLSLVDPAAAFGETPEVNDPELKKIFDAVKISGPGRSHTTASDDIAAMRKQSVLSFNALMNAYGEAGPALKQQLDSLPELPAPPKRGAKGQSFDL